MKEPEMRKPAMIRPQRMHSAVAVCMLLAFETLLTGCNSSCSVGLSSGRSVNVSSDSFRVTARGGKDTATIDVGNKRVVIEPTRVLVAGAEVATIDAKVRKVSVQRAREEIVVLADGRTVYDSRLSEQPKQ